jgi:acrylyl-CoA reductase (NADPH)
MEFRALLLEKDADGNAVATVQSIGEDRLPAGDVTVAVEYSTLNYKDGLCLSPSGGGLVRAWPHVSGIDFAGVVAASDDPRFAVGERVVLTGWRVGEVHWGGHAERARVRADWLVKLPDGISTRAAMAVGTAGFTAMLAVMALEDHGLRPGAGEVLVTGAAGGVGSVAVALLAGLGYQVAAVTGRPEQEGYLRGLGAARIVARADLAETVKRPLEAETWAGCVDAVGGAMLARVLGQMKYGASVVAVGLAGGAALPATVIPFLLRGVNLLGIDSVMRPHDDRVRAWARIARDLPMDKLEAMVQPATLEELPALGAAILRGEVRGRVVVDPRIQGNG